MRDEQLPVALRVIPGGRAVEDDDHDEEDEDDEDFPVEIRWERATARDLPAELGDVRRLADSGRYVVERAWFPEGDAFRLVPKGRGSGQIEVRISVYA